MTIKHIDFRNAKKFTLEKKIVFALNCLVFNNYTHHDFFWWYSLHATSIKNIASRHDDDDDSYCKLRITVNKNSW